MERHISLRSLITQELIRYLRLNQTAAFAGKFELFFIPIEDDKED